MNANITIKKAADGTPRLIAQVGEGSKCHFMLMEYDYITLKFSVPEPAQLLLGDYVDIDGAGRYELTAPARGELNASTGGYDYEIRLDAQYWKFKNKLFKFLPQIGANETSWTYTDTLPRHAQQILFNIRALAYSRGTDGTETRIPGRESYLYNGVTDWSVEWDASVDTAKAVTIQYQSRSIIDAIADIAEAFECEWWFAAGVLHFGKCQHGAAPAVLEMGKELVDISRSDSKEGYATRIYAYGSTRNLASNYRKSLIFDASVSDGAVFDSSRELEIDWFANGTVTKIADRRGGNQCLYGELVDHQHSIARRSEQAGSSFTSVYADYACRPFTGDMPYQGTSHVLSLAGVEIRLTQHSGPLTGVAKAVVVVHASYDNESDGKSCEYFENTAEAPIEQLGTPVTLRFADRKIVSKSIPRSFAMQMEIYVEADDAAGEKRVISATISGPAAVCYYPEWQATGVEIEVLDKVSGNIKKIISGATFNVNYDKQQRKIWLPPGATVSPGDKYRLPQLNNAVVPARYFTSIYDVFDKYEDVTTNGIVTNRLLLPQEDEEGNPLHGYLDAIEFESDEEAVEDVVIFDDIYPSRVSKVTAVEQSEEFATELPEQDGSTSRTSYREYIIQDDLFTPSNPFNRDAYLIDGTGLQVTFQSGALNGMTFDVELLDDDYRFQIKRDDTTQLPNIVIKPQIGDEFILHGFNIAMLSDANTDYIARAEQELLRKTKEYIAKLNTDASTYQCTLACDYAYAAIQAGNALTVGRSVNLIHPGYFKDGRVSRVLGYEMPLDIPYDNPVFFIGEKASYSRIGAIEDRLDSIGGISGNLGAALSGTAPAAADPSAHAHSNLPTLERLRADSEGYLLLTRRSADGEGVELDKARAGHADTAAALTEDSPSRAWFLSRLHDDVASGRVTFEKAAAMLGGITIGDYREGLRGGRVTAEGGAEVESLRVRSFMEVSELVSLRSAVIEGTLSLSERAEVETLTAAAQGRVIAAVRPQAGGCALDRDDVVYGFASDGLARGKAWAKVVAKDGDTLTLMPYADADVPGGRNLPLAEGMTLTRHGNTRDPRRQQHFVISSDEGRLYMLQGARSPLTGDYGVVLGKLPAGLAPDAPVNADHPYVYARGLVARDLIRLDRWTGDPVREAVYRGQWQAGRAYHCDDAQYDTVTRGGVLYQCDADGTTEPPAPASTAWTAVAGDAAADLGVWSIVSDPACVRPGKVDRTRAVTLTAMRATPGGVEVCADSEALAARGAVMITVATTPGGAVTASVNIGPSGRVTAEGGQTLTAEDGGHVELEGDSIVVPFDATAFTAELREAAGGKLLASLAIPIVRDGADGKDGSPGKDGAAGPVAYPAGVYSPTATYDSTSGACPVVMEGAHYYRLAPGITACGVDPAADVAAQGGTWILVDRFDTVFASVVMAEYGKLNSAVFAGGWMYSRQGVRRLTMGGSVTEVCGSDYQLFDPSKPYRDSAQGFRPNVAVNFATGEIHTPQFSIAGGKLAAFGSGGARFEFGLDEAGMPVLAYYGEDGQRLYDLGPGGYTPPPASADAYDEVRLLRLSTDDADLDALTPAQVNEAKSPAARSVYYRRRSDGKLYPAKSLSAAPAEGIYAGEVRYKPQMVGQPSDTDRTVAVYRYIGGLITQTRNIDFNSDTL